MGSDTVTRRQVLQASLAGGALAAAGGDLTRLSLSEASAMLRRKAVSPLELTAACLRRIERLNPALNAFITVTGDQAMQQARAAAAEMQRGVWRGPLHGIPIALKDLIDTAGVRTTAGSALWADRVPAKDAEVVRRLKAAGAVLVGKLNMDEFAYSFTSETSHFGPVQNPWKHGYIPGGSSSGSAAAVAAGLCYGAMGSDTGGSIREPASYCGVVGLKPTYGRVSVEGVAPLSWTLDHVGPMARTVRDASLMLGVIAAPEPDLSPAAFRLGVPRAVFYEGLDPEVEAAIDEAQKVLGRLTAGLRDVVIPMLQSSPVLIAEAYAYHQENLAKTPDLYHPRVLRNLLRGADVKAAAYIHARRQLDQLRSDTAAVFGGVDLLITPTSPVLPISLEPSREPDPILLRNTRPFNWNGLPSISIPCGYSRSGLPIGLQISGPGRGESKVLALAAAFERATQWHARHPPLSVE